MMQATKKKRNQSGIDRLHSTILAGRLTWLDATKGISILLIVFFHFFSAYGGAGYPWPVNLYKLPSIVSQCAPSSSIADIFFCAPGALVAAIFQRGPQAVGVLLFLSGFGLTYSLVKKGIPEGGWIRWYRKRLLRLFPMYWVAHLIYLVSPFVHRQDPIEWRFLLSLLGDRVYPVDKMFYYICPSWWFFGLLIELYLVFPLLFRLQKKVGPSWFLAICGLVTVSSRYMLFGVIKADGNYIQGAFFAARLFEFAAGMALAVLYKSRPDLAAKWLFSGRTFFYGLVLYNLGSYFYQPTFALAFSDAFIGIGLFIILAHVSRWLIRFLPAASTVLIRVGVYSYGLYLLHQPYVIYLGKRMGDLGMPVFVICAAVIVTVITFGTVCIERYVNQWVDRTLERRQVALIS
ncbi:MAG: acyltransferase family protein [Syntrophobacteraceae bacterium]